MDSLPKRKKGAEEETERKNRENTGKDEKANRRLVCGDIQRRWHHEEYKKEKDYELPP